MKILAITACTAGIAHTYIAKEKLENAVQIAWATGGRLVPEEIRKVYLKTCL